MENFTQIQLISHNLTQFNHNYHIIVLYNTDNKRKEVHKMKLTLEKYVKDGEYNSGETMMGYKMLHAISVADSWDETGVCPKDETITAKDLLISLCIVLGIDYKVAETYCDLFNELWEVIDSVH